MTPAWPLLILLLMPHIAGNKSERCKYYNLLLMPHSAENKRRAMEILRSVANECYATLGISKPSFVHIVACCRPPPSFQPSTVSAAHACIWLWWMILFSNGQTCVPTVLEGGIFEGSDRCGTNLFHCNQVLKSLGSLTAPFPALFKH